MPGAVLTKNIRLLFSVFLLSGWFCCSQHPNRRVDHKRIGCFPVIKTESGLCVALTDAVTDALIAASPGNWLVYQQDWFWHVIDSDSLFEPSYCIQTARRIGLDYLVTCEVILPGDNAWELRILCSEVPEGGQVWQIEENVASADVNTVLHHVTTRMSEEIDPDFNPTEIGTRYPPALWNRFGAARYHALRGDLSNAEQAYRSNLDLHVRPKALNALADVLLSQALERKKEEGVDAEALFVEIHDLLQRSLSQDSLISQTYRLLGHLAIQQERWNAAQRALLRANDLLLREDPLLYFDLSRLHQSRYRAMDFSSKSDLLKRAVYLNPAFEEAWIELAEDAYFRSKPDQAESIYRRMIAINPRSLDALLGLGRLYAYRNEVLRLINVYQRILDIDPTCTVAYYNLGIAYLNDHKEDEAFRLFERAVELDEHPDSYYYLGVIHSRRGEREKALAAFRSRIRLRRGQDDAFAEEARKHVVRLLSELDQT